MRIMIISDIHLNLTALKAVIENEKFNELIVLGDIVGYGPYPNECIEYLLQFNPTFLKGNHEEALSNLKYKILFNPLARKAIDFTKKELKKKHIKFLKKLPYEIKDNNIHFSHSSPYHPERFTYLPEGEIDNADLKLSFFKMERESINVAFIGHTHYPGYFSKLNSKISFVAFNENDNIKIDNNNLYIINVGSVGQPRNNNPKAQYVIYDTENSTVSYINREYNIDEIANSFIENSLPEELYLRLYKGI